MRYDNNNNNNNKSNNSTNIFKTNTIYNNYNNTDISTYRFLYC